jgi:hypothetical protein
MANLATLEFRPIAVEPKSVSLDAVRRALEAAGLMARGDRFLNKDLAGEIARDAESSETLETASKEATGGLRVLTLRLGPKESEVKVVKGEASWLLKPDVTQTLASFRRDLAGRNLMTAADQFWRKGGPIVDEGGYSIEAALDQGVLTIGAPASQTIVIAKGVKPENLKSVGVDASQTLAQLRAKLEADKFMTSADTFVGSDGKVISKSQEAGGSIKAVLGANKFLTITSGWM